MLDIAIDFESTAKYLHGVVLVVPGVVLVLAGLWLWLASSSRHKFFAAVFAGAIAAAVAALLAVNIFALVIAILLAVFAGALFPKQMIVLSGAVTVAMVAMMAIYSLKIQDFPSPNRFFSSVNQKLDIPESVEFLNKYSVFAGGEILNIVKSLQAKSIIIISACWVVFLVIGLFIPKIITALLGSFWGIVLIGKGMLLLVLYKGTLVVSRVKDNPGFYLYIAAGMLIFGVVVQLVLCPAVFNRLKKAKKDENDGDDKDE